jgi:hypothetical protein
MPFHRRDLRRLMLERVEPWVSPAKIWTGATSAAIHIAIENILRACVTGVAQQMPAPTAPTTSEVVR